MTAFPQTIHFIGTNTPRRLELSIRNLAVEGEIPPEIDGAFFRVAGVRTGWLVSLLYLFYVPFFISLHLHAGLVQAGGGQPDGSTGQHQQGLPDQGGHGEAPDTCIHGAGQP